MRHSIIAPNLIKCAYGNCGHYHNLKLKSACFNSTFMWGSSYIDVIAMRGKSFVSAYSTSGYLYLCSLF